MQHWPVARLCLSGGTQPWPQPLVAPRADVTLLDRQCCLGCMPVPGKQQRHAEPGPSLHSPPTKKRYTGLHCMAPGCTNYSKKIPNVHCHRLPLGDANLVIKWLGRMKLARPPKLQYSRVLISLMKTTRQRFILIRRVGDLFLSRPAI